MNDRDLGEYGLRAALDRFREGIRSPDTPAAVASLGEVLAWCFSLEELHRKRLSDPVYFAQRNGSMPGRTLAGLIYSRNLFTHQLAASAELVTLPPALRYTHSAAGTTVITPGPVVPAFTWMPFSSLPLPDKPESHQRDVYYQQHVDGRPVLEPLDTAVGFLTSLP